MAVITTATIVVGSVIVALGASMGVGIALTADDREKANLQNQINKLKAENNALNQAEQYIKNVQTKLYSASKYLSDARLDFKNGGHVYNEIPLSNSEFEKCLKNISTGIVEAGKLMNDFKLTVENNKKIINKNEKRLQELNK